MMKIDPCKPPCSGSFCLTSGLRSPGPVPFTVTEAGQGREENGPLQLSQPLPEAWALCTQTQHEEKMRHPAGK